MSLTLKMPFSTIPNARVRLKLSNYSQKAFDSSTTRARTIVTNLDVTSRFDNTFIEKSSETSTQVSQQQRVRRPIRSANQKFTMIVPSHKSYLLTLEQKLKQQAQQQKVRSKKVNSLMSRNNQKHQQLMLKVKEKRQLLEQRRLDQYIQSPPQSIRFLRRTRHPSACFMTLSRQSRPKIRTPMLIQQLGPCAYQLKSQFRQERQKERARKNEKTDVMERIKQIVKQQNQYQQVQVLQQAEMKDEESQEHNWPQFIKNDHDRFGESYFPLVLRNRAPGPGHYEQKKNTIEQMCAIVRAHEDQKRVLQSWFKNQFQ